MLASQWHRLHESLKMPATSPADSCIRLHVGQRLTVRLNCSSVVSTRRPIAIRPLNLFSPVHGFRYEFFEGHREASFSAKAKAADSTDTGLAACEAEKDGQVSPALSWSLFYEYLPCRLRVTRCRPQWPQPTWVSPCQNRCMRNTATPPCDCFPNFRAALSRLTADWSLPQGNERKHWPSLTALGHSSCRTRSSRRLNGAAGAADQSASATSARWAPFSGV